MIENEKGSITIWFVALMFVLVLLMMELFAMFQLLYYRHAIDAAMESAALAGASNAIETYVNNTVQVNLNKEKADAESSWLFLENIKKNGLSKSFEIREFKTEVETDRDQRIWYKCTTIVDMRVDGPIRLDIHYLSSSKGEVTKNVIKK